MAYQLICDLCGKPIIDGANKRYRIKERWVSWYESGWVTIDAHEECVKKLIDSVKENKEEKENENTESNKT